MFDNAPHLREGDLRSQVMGNSGEDIMMSPLARDSYPWCVEVKRSKRATASRWMEQAKGHGKYEPVAVFREDNQKEWYAIVRFDYLLELNKK